MINVGRVVNSRNFAQPGGFTVFRQTGAWSGGRWVSQPEVAIIMQGTVTVATQEDLEQVPEGDRVTGMMSFYSQQMIYRTRSEDDQDPGGTSDEIFWRGERYRVAAVLPWLDFGYCKAIGARMGGD
ncbi:hypothetical protein [Paenibacillus sp. GCM10012303]|uniref:hypothetical protein n=1 Tax=Paenibacillus sp. GCM10012303 TaxID=3317340 RepID=UPI0036150F22